MVLLNILIPRVFFIQFSTYLSSFFSSSYSCFVTRIRSVQSSSSSSCNEENNKDLDLLRNLPGDMTMDILSRLPNIGSALKCKVVCKAWRDAIESVGYHLSKPDQHLVYFTNFVGLNSKPYKIVQLIREDDEIPYKDEPEWVMFHLHLCPEILGSVPPRSSVEGAYNSHLVVLKLALRGDLLDPVLRSSVRGLILLHCQPQHRFLVCNPFTSEYVSIPNPPGYHRYCQEEDKNFNFGFGFSRTSHQYKLVHIFRGGGCQVYTLGLGGTARQWRSIAAGPTPRYSTWNAERAFAAGNLHWLHPQTEDEFCCFDLETELFTYFSAPPPPPQSERSVCVLNECLCLCDVLPKQIEVWLMKGKGGDWSKEFVIGVGTSVGYLFPIKVLEDGDMLFSQRDSAHILYYKNKTKTGGGRGRITTLYPVPYLSYKARTAVYTPNFVSLKTLFMEKEDVQLFSFS